MIKRSIFVVAALLASVANSRSVHTHGPRHAAHVAAAKTQVAPADIKVEDINLDVIQNADICSFYTEESFYVLKFIIAQGYNYNLTESRVNETIEFNICSPLNGIANVNDTCYGTFACLTDSEGKRIPLSGKDFKSSIKPHVQFDRMDDSDKGGLTLTYEGSENSCSNDTTKKLSLKVDLYCDADAERNGDNDAHGLNFTDYQFGQCQIGMRMKSKHACYVFSLGPFFRYVSKYYFLFGLGMIIMGLFVGFFGRKLIHPTICMIGSLLFVTLSGWLIFTLAFDRDSSEVTEWIVFGVCCVIGIFVGLLLAWLAKYTAAGLSAYGAVCLGLILYTSFLFKYDNDKQVLFWIFIIGMGIVGGVLGFVLYNHALIISTSIIGSFLFIRGISLYAGGFPNEMLIIEQIKNGQLSEFPGTFWAYFAGFIILTVGMIVVQYKMFNKMDEKDKHPYHRLR